MADYTLQKDGDYWEKKWWPYFNDSFPNYEIFWRTFIAEPLTNRPDDIRIRKDIDEVLEALAMAHYSVFYHLGNTHWLTELNVHIQQSNSETNREPTLHPEYFFHLSTATEMVERLMFEIWKIAIKVELLPSIKQLSDKSIENELVEVLGGNGYTKRFEKYLITGQGVNHTFHSIRDAEQNLIKLVDNLEGWKKNWSEFRSITDGNIRAYRNVLAHNPILGSKESEGIKQTPKPVKLSQYRLWSSVLYSRNDEDFILIDEFIAEQLYRLESTLNELWASFICIMDKISNTEKYSGLSADRKVLVSGNTEDQILTTSSSSIDISVSSNPPIEVSGTDIDPNT